MITFSKYYQILEEDLQSSLNQANKILTSNGLGETEAIQSIKKIEHLIHNVGNLDPQQSRFNVDSNIPILAYLLITILQHPIGTNPHEVLKREYIAYLNSPRATGNNILVKAFGELRQVIQQNKWFKPSKEKDRYILDWGNRLIAKIHEFQVVATDTNKKFVSGEITDDVAYEDETITVYRADSKAKCIKYGAGSTLCISTKGGGNYYWSYRMGNMHREGLGMTTYFVYWKDGSNRILIDALGDEDGPANKYSWNPIRPNTDRDVTAMGLIKQYPELEEPFLKDVFQFIPYGEKEKRYHHIEENVTSILDNSLKTLEDYDMFIESLDFDDPYADFRKAGHKEFITYEDFKELEKRIGLESVSYLVKKYAGLGNILTSISMDEYLSSKDKEWYLDVLIKKFDDNSDYFDYFRLIGRNIPHKMIEEYFTNFHSRDEYGVGESEHIHDFVRKVILNVEEDDDINIYDLIYPLFEYMFSRGLKPSDFFLGKNLTPDLIKRVFSNFVSEKNHTQSQAYSRFLFKLIEFYKKNNIQVPKILFRCIANDPHLAATYLIKWYKHKIHEGVGVFEMGMPNKSLLTMAASRKSAAMNLLTNLLYDISGEYVKLDVNIPTYIVDVLKNDPRYKQFLDTVEIITGYSPYKY